MRTSLPRVEGAALLVKALQNEGVRHIFSVSGGSINPIYNACLDAGIPIIHTRHEGAAAFMADGWARLTRQPGVCAVTLGPGVANTTTGILTAYLAGSPIIVIGGHCPSNRVDLGAFAVFDQVAVMRPITKWARTVADPSRLPEYVGMAFRHALSGRPGPVFLDIPLDVLTASVDENWVASPFGHRTTARPQADSQRLQEALELIAVAERPVAFVGSGVWWAQAAEELRSFAEAAGLPVFTEKLGRGSLPADHPLNFGLGAFALNEVAVQAARECDLVLMVGNRFDYMIEYGRSPFFSPGVKAIQIGLEPAEIGHNRPIEVGLVGDAKAVLAQLRAGLKAAPRTTPWLHQLEEARSARWRGLAPLLASEEVPIHPLRLCREIREFLRRDAIVITSGGDIEQWGRMYLEPYLPGHYLRAGQTGSLGVDIPYAVAAKLAHPDKQVLVLTGDGGFGFSAMELDTAARHHLPFVCVIANDSCWGQIKRQQELSYGKEKTVATDLAFRRYEKIAEVLGGYGQLVTQPQEIRPALERAFASGLPSCINVVTASVVSPETLWLHRMARRQPANLAVCPSLVK